MIGIRRKYKSRLIFCRNSNRIIIREVSSHESWPENGRNLSTDETVWLMGDHIIKSAKDAKKVCPYAVQLRGMLFLDPAVNYWLEENATDRFCCVDFTEDKRHLIMFKSEEDATHFQLRWGGDQS